MLALFASVAALMVWGGGRRGGDPLAFHLPVAGVLLAVWLGFQTTDPAETTLASSPTTLLRRRLLRMGPSVLAIGSIWVLLCVQADAGAKVTTLSAFFLATICVAAAGSAVGERVTGFGHGGPVAVGALFAVFALAPAILRVPWSIDPSMDTWSHLYGRWLLIAGGGVLCFLLASVDPARRPIRA
jgi:hypothetical protein